jgi:hypothetical protein
LDYQEIQLTFQEICLVTYGEERHTRLVITEGREFTYRWNNPVWEVTLENPDQNLVNPRIHHLPQDTLDDELNPTYIYTALTELNDLTLSDREERLLQEDLPPSSSWTSRAPISDIGWEMILPEIQRVVGVIEKFLHAGIVQTHHLSVAAG